jgi:hypothetical protein
MQIMDDESQERMIAGYRALADFFTKKGFKTSHSTMAKYCSPAINIGPPCEGYWGRLPIFKPSRALEWARNRMRHAQHADTAA